MGWPLLRLLSDWLYLECYPHTGYVYLVHWRDDRHRWTVLERESIVAVAVRLLRIQLGEDARTVGGVGNLRLVTS